MRSVQLKKKGINTMNIEIFLRSFHKKNSALYLKFLQKYQKKKYFPVTIVLEENNKKEKD